MGLQCGRGEGSQSDLAWGSVASKLRRAFALKLGNCSCRLRVSLGLRVSGLGLPENGFGLITNCRTFGWKGSPGASGVLVVSMVETWWSLAGWSLGDLLLVSCGFLHSPKNGKLPVRRSSRPGHDDMLCRGLSVFGDSPLA